MSDSTTTTSEPASDPTIDGPPQQLTLLPSSEVPVQFRLDSETRRLGLMQVAKMRALLEQRRAAREAADGLHRLRPPAAPRDRAA